MEFAKNMIYDLQHVFAEHKAPSLVGIWPADITLLCYAHRIGSVVLLSEWILHEQAFLGNKLGEGTLGAKSTKKYDELLTNKIILSFKKTLLFITQCIYYLFLYINISLCGFQILN